MARRKRKGERATVNVRVYESTHRLLVELAARLYTTQAEAIDRAVRECLKTAAPDEGEGE